MGNGGVAVGKKKANARLEKDHAMGQKLLIDLGCLWCAGEKQLE